MDTLFNKPEKRSVDKTKIDAYVPVFASIGYTLMEKPPIPFESKADIVMIESIETGKYLLAMQWLRPISRSKLKMTWALSNYPRLNIPSAAMKAPDCNKVAASMFTMTRWNMYFLVVLPNTKEDMFWLGRYDEIPLECWKLNWWKDRAIPTRLLLHNFKDYNLVNLEGLKKQLDKLF